MIPLKFKLSKPTIAKFLLDWTTTNENRVFEFANEKDKQEFATALTSLVQSIAQTAHNGSISLIIGDDGVESVYLRIK